jgi:poly(3-hydroxyoctanoate) depolymerase
MFVSLLSACGATASGKQDAAGLEGPPLDGVADAAMLPGLPLDAAAPGAPLSDATQSHMQDGALRPSGEDAGLSSATDAGSGDTADAGSTVPACVIAASVARCQSQPVQQIGVASDVRRVYWAEPTTAAPAGGYPAVILYQGTGYGPSTTWDVDIADSTEFGGYYQVVLVARLLERGFVVIQPEAQGGTFWSTNVALDYATSADGVFIPLLLSAVQQGTFGHVDESRLYATGISSGGYMTSRMAVSYPGRFRALAIESASYATCAGPLCNVPTKLPADHPPTLLLHGDADLIVPISTAKDYHQSLVNNGIATSFIEDANAGHQWLSSAPDAVVNWFLAH